MKMTRYDKSILLIISFLLCIILFGGMALINKNNSLRAKTALLTEQVIYNKKLVKDHEIKIKNLQKRIDEINNVTVTATAYNAVVEQTDDDPDVTSCNVKPTVGSIAVSQDLFYKGWTCGKWVKIRYLGVYKIKRILDVMHYRKKEQIDIVMNTEEEALNFGVKENLNAVLLPAYETL